MQVQLLFEATKSIEIDMIEAKGIKNEDGTFRVVDMNDEPLKLKLNFGGKNHEILCDKHLEFYNLCDLKCYGVNIINLDELYNEKNGCSAALTS